VGPNNNRPGARRKKLEYSWWARPAKSHLLTSSPPQAARIPTASRFVLPRWLRWVPPTIAATTNFRLHFKCLDNRGFGYILRWLDGEGPYILGLKTPRLYGPPGKAEPSCGVIRYNRTSMANEKKSSWSSHRRAIWEIAIFGLCSGILITALMLAENHLLGVAHSSEIYTLLVAVVFAGGGIWLGLTLIRRNATVVQDVAMPAPGPFRPDEEHLSELKITPRELEILGLIAEGLSTREIADKLFVSESTVKTHSSRLFDKLGAKRRTQAVQLGKVARLIP